MGSFFISILFIDMFGSHATFYICTFQEHLDYEIIQSLNPEFNKAVVRVNVFREHRQTIQVDNLGCTMSGSVAYPSQLSLSVTLAFSHFRPCILEAVRSCRASIDSSFLDTWLK